MKLSPYQEEVTAVSVSVDGKWDGSTWPGQAWYPWTIEPYSPSVPNWAPPDEIRLTMDEVAALKRAADADDEVRAALNKIAKRIRVDVEF